MLPQWHVKDPGHSSKRADGRLHLNMRTPLDPTKSEWTGYAVQAECANLSGTELTRNLSGNIRPQLSQLAEPLWIHPDIRSGTFELIYTWGVGEWSTGGE